MIKIKNNKVKMEGNRPDLLTDLTCIVKGLKECFEENGTSKEVSEKLIREAVDIAFWDEEKLCSFPFSFRDQPLQVTQRIMLQLRVPSSCFLTPDLR